MIAAFKQARMAALAASERLGQDMLALDVREQTSLADCFLFVGANSHVHVRALEDGIREKMREEGTPLLRTDGQRGHLWRVLDFGGLIVHIMEKKTREFYAVERLWNEATKIALAEPPAAHRKTKPVSRKIKPAPRKKRTPKK
jgi:ribosome-associated protein